MLSEGHLVPVPYHMGQTGESQIVCLCSTQQCVRGDQHSKHALDCRTCLLIWIEIVAGMYLPGNLAETS